ncbi:MAG: hypothetical protein WC859_00830 [Elusimicrobiota bacterium]|jgi:hypothetical protein
MGLQDLISQMNNPQEFVRLCNAVFVATYGQEYCAVDGTQCDGGNDGYIRSEHKMLAMYCPVKPEKDTDTKYLEKIRNDLDKAKKLVDTSKYRIKQWTFVTPRKLSSHVIAELIREANSRGFSGNYLEATYLANQLFIHSQILRDFPALNVPDIDSRLREITDLLLRTHKIPELNQSVPISTSSDAKSPDQEKALEICTGPRTTETKTALKTLYYKTSDDATKLQCVMGLLNWFSPANGDTLEDQLHYCDAGLMAANRLNAFSEKAVILAYKGQRLSDQFGEEELAWGHSLKVEAALGISIQTAEQKQERMARIRSIYEDATKSFTEAQDIAQQLGDYKVLGEVYLHIGCAAGLRFIHVNGMGAHERAAAEKKLCKDSLMLAKDIYSTAGDQLNIGYALMSLANQIRTFGEMKQATDLCKEALKIGEEYHDAALLQNGKALLNRLVTGKIPDYIHGERFGDEPA